MLLVLLTVVGCCWLILNSFYFFYRFCCCTINLVYQNDGNLIHWTSHVHIEKVSYLRYLREEDAILAGVCEAGNTNPNTQEGRCLYALAKGTALPSPAFKVYSNTAAFAVILEDGSVIPWGMCAGGGSKSHNVLSSSSYMKDGCNKLTTGNFNDIGCNGCSHVSPGRGGAVKIYGGGENGYGWFTAVLQDGSLAQWGWSSYSGIRGFESYGADITSSQIAASRTKGGNK